MAENEKDFVVKTVLLGFICLITLVGFLWGCNYLYRQYAVWSESMRGKAELAHAEFNRQIAVKEAEAQWHSAVELAKAEVERAKGVAKANQIIGESLKANENYIRYLWVTNLEKGNRLIYVPTEAGLPILEANRAK